MRRQARGGLRRQPRHVPRGGVRRGRDRGGDDRVCRTRVGGRRICPSGRERAACSGSRRSGARRRENGDCGDTGSARSTVVTGRVRESMRRARLAREGDVRGCAGSVFDIDDDADEAAGESDARRHRRLVSLQSRPAHHLQSLPGSTTCSPWPPEKFLVLLLHLLDVLSVPPGLSVLVRSALVLPKHRLFRATFRLGASPRGGGHLRLPPPSPPSFSVAVPVDAAAASRSRASASAVHALLARSSP